MVKGLENNGHILYIDNYYMTVKIIEYLKNKMIATTGTMKKRMRDLSPEMKLIKKLGFLIFLINIIL